MAEQSTSTTDGDPWRTPSRQVGKTWLVRELAKQYSTVIPIEVKAGAKGSMQSLHLFMKLKQLSMAVRCNTNLPSKILVDTKLSSGERVEYQLLSLPLYMIGQLKRLLEAQ